MKRVLEIFTRLILSLIVVAVSGSGWAQTSGGRWRLNEGSGVAAGDDLGTANNGTLKNTEAEDWRSDNPAEGSYYLRLDGINEMIEVSDSQDSELDFTTDLTLEAYIRATDVTSQAAIISKSSAILYRLAITADDHVKLSLRIGTNFYHLEGITDVIDGNWHHVAGTYDQTNGMRVWVDRVLEASDPTVTGSINTDNGSLRIGAQTSTGTDAFPGDIDFVQALNGFDASLPITLTSFTATAGDGQVILRWVTESEIDNSGFEIWRSLRRDDGYVKLPIFIPGAGNTASRHDYEYTDRGLTNGTTYYYKLIDIDFGGHRTEHGPVFATPHSERVKGAETKSVPKTYRLAPNYPNPFNPATRIRFDIPLSEKNPGSAVTAKVKIFDIAGREVATLVEEPLGPGSYEVTWDGVNSRGERVGSGVYLCVFETEAFSEVRKMTLVR